MKLVVKNGFLINQDQKYKCSIGYNGLSKDKAEGDGCTPVGTFKLNKIMYRPDKINNFKSNLETEIIEKKDGWCDDINSELYNQKIIFSYELSAENLYRDDDLYDLICIIDYNLNPIIKGKGSAIFLHVASSDYSPTHGCVAIKKDGLIEIAKKLNRDSSIQIDD